MAHVTKSDLHDAGCTPLTPANFMARITHDFEQGGDIFQKIVTSFADGTKLDELVYEIQELGGFTATPATVSDMLKRKGAWGDRSLIPMFDSVEPHVWQAVKGRWWKKNGSTKKAVAETSTRLDLLHAALEAYEPWAKARDACIADGVTEENLRAWISITREDV